MTVPCCRGSYASPGPGWYARLEVERMLCTAVPKSKFDRSVWGVAYIVQHGSLIRTGLKA